MRQLASLLFLLMFASCEVVEVDPDVIEEYLFSNLSDASPRPTTKELAGVYQVTVNTNDPNLRIIPYETQVSERALNATELVISLPQECLSNCDKLLGNRFPKTNISVTVKGFTLVIPAQDIRIYDQYQRLDETKKLKAATGRVDNSKTKLTFPITITKYSGELGLEMNYTLIKK